VKIDEDGSVISMPARKFIKRKKIMKSIFCLFIVMSFVTLGFGIDITETRSFSLIQDDDNFIKCPGSFFVTEDDLIFILDKKGSDIKIYNFKGELVDVFGKKGVGPDEFITPFYGTYAKPWVVFMDFGRRNFFIYKRSPQNVLEFSNKFIELGYISSYQIMPDGDILIVGDKKNKNNKIFSISIYNHLSNTYEYLLPFEKSYGESSMEEWMKNEKYGLIGTEIYGDWLDDTVFHVWIGELKIMRLNRKSKEISYFGNKTKNYIQPSVTPEIRKAFKERKNDLYFSLGKGMSFVRYLFTMNSGHVGVIYMGGVQKHQKPSIMLQIYTSSGGFVKETELLRAQASSYNELYYFFRKDKNLLYVLDTETSKDFDQFYKIHEYRIN
jgi:hypothetical protein